MKIVIDTNVWISFLLGKSFQNIFDLIENYNLTVYTSQEQIQEIIETIKKPKLSKYLESEDINNLIFLFNYNFKFVEISNNFKFLRDPKDDYLLEVAIISKSKYLITGDKDFLDLKNYNDIEFVNYKKFIDEILK